MKRSTLILALVAAGLALIAGLAVGQLGTLGLVVLVGIGLAAAAFVDLRITVLAIVPAMVLLPELPLSIPLRTEDLLMAPLAGAWSVRLALGRETVPRTPLNAPLLVVIAIEFFALVWGAYRGTAGLSPELYSASFFFIKTVEVTFLFFIVQSSIRSQRDLRLFTYVFIAAATALGIWGVIERGSRAMGEAITGPAGHGGYSLLGLTFVVLLVTLLSLFLTERSRTLRLLLMAAALPVAYSLTFTFSRQGYVGAVAAIGAIIWVRDRRLIFPALAIALALPFFVPEVIQDRAMSIVPGSAVSAGELSPYAARQHALKRRLPEVLTRSPLVGFGPAALPPGFLDNQYLLTIYYTGILGLAAFLWLLWRALITGYRSYRKLEGGRKGLALAWLAATVGLGIAGLAGNPFVAVRVREVYWFLAALALAAVRLAEESRPEAEPISEEPGYADADVLEDVARGS